MTNAVIFDALESDVRTRTERLIGSCRRLATARTNADASALQTVVQQQTLALAALLTDLRLLSEAMSTDAAVQARSGLRVVK
jgi:hypothetical protein